MIFFVDSLIYFLHTFLPQYHSIIAPPTYCTYSVSPFSEADFHILNLCCMYKQNTAVCIGSLEVERWDIPGLYTLVALLSQMKALVGTVCSWAQVNFGKTPAVPAQGIMSANGKQTLL